MPGRVASGRRAVASKASAKSLRNSSDLVEIPDEGDNSSLRRAICTTFADSQKSTAGHRKAIISLRKVQEACCYEPVSGAKGKQDDEFDEDDFNREVARCVLRILAVKKAEPVGDRVVRFLGTFLSTASGKDNEIALSEGGGEESILPETPTTRLTTQLVETLIPLTRAKDKVIRFRATQIISHIINSLDTLDDTLFHRLRQELLKRIHDKEASVRLQAVYGLGRLAAEVEHDEDREDSDSDEDLGTGVVGKLLSVLQNDPSAEVRRNLLLNLPITKEVLPYLLERARDADATTRKALYGRLLPALGDFRHLSLTHREKLLRWGLRDRDENVRKATARLFRERWIEDCAALPAVQIEEGDTEKSADQAAKPSLDALLELLERIDVFNSGGEGGIALIAMREFWDGRPDYLDYVSFPDSFWEDLSPELAFVARTFNEYCRNPGENYVGPRSSIDLAEEKLPEVTKFGYLLEREIKRLVNSIIVAATEEEGEDGEEEATFREFIVEQMLHMALTFDYSDEVGRRKMFGLMREALALPDLPEEVTRLVVEVLRLVCGHDAKGEREFCGIVLEAIAEVHDTIMGEDDDEESFHSATSHPDGDDEDTVMPVERKSKKGSKQNDDPETAQEKVVKEIMVNMKCLHISLCMLQNISGDLEENPHLVTMLNSLVVPAVRSQEAPLRERGLMCLGLCCLLGKNLAEENLTLLLHCFAKGHAGLKTVALQIITDIIIAHPTILTPHIKTNEDGSTEEVDPVKPIAAAYKKALKSDSPEVQATGATALSKAMLSRLITDPDLLRQLVVLYFEPDSFSNPQLRQTLTYFLPVYCHSRAENAKLMAEIATGVVSKLQTIKTALEEDDDEDAADPDSASNMVHMGRIVDMLVEWTDPRKIFGFSEAVKDASAASGAGETHFILAESILDRLTTATGKMDRRKDDKVYFSMLGKLYMQTGGCGSERLRTVLELVTEAIEGKIAPDATSRNILSKLQTQLLKLMHDIMTEERGGGDTVLDLESPDGEQTEIGNATTVDPVGEDEEADEDEVEEDDDVTQQLQQEMKDATLGATMTGFGFTTGLPDAEGTRIQFANEVDDDEEEDTGIEESVVEGDGDTEMTDV